MTKLKKIFILLTLFLFFLSCGYTPIFSKKDVNFSIVKIEFLGDNDVGKNIDNVLSSYKNKAGKEKEISLAIVNSKNITIASKNSKGEAETNRINVDVDVKIILAEKFSMGGNCVGQFTRQPRCFDYWGRLFGRVPTLSPAGIRL